MAGLALATQWLHPLVQLLGTNQEGNPVLSVAELGELNGTTLDRAAGIPPETVVEFTVEIVFYKLVYGSRGTIGAHETDSEEYEDVEEGLELIRNAER